MAAAEKMMAIDFRPATGQLYGVSSASRLYVIHPDSGTARAIGAAGFDITDNNMAYTALRVGSRSRLYVVNLTTGRVLNVGNSDFGSDNIIGLAIPTTPVAYSVDGMNNLLIFNPFDPKPILKPITGMGSGETILGLDMRPANGQLYALGSSSRLYTLNTSSGAATAVGTAAFTPALSGTAIGFDFNPTVDRIRIVSNTGQNLRAHPETGLIAAVDGAINPSGSTITAAAYTNNFAGTTSTTLFVIDAQNQRLFIQNPPNNGTLVNVGGSFDKRFAGENGFDIGSKSNRAFVLLNNEGDIRIHNLNLTTGVLDNGRMFPSTAVNGFTLGLGF